MIRVPRAISWTAKTPFPRSPAERTSMRLEFRTEKDSIWKGLYQISHMLLLFGEEVQNTMQ